MKLRPMAIIVALMSVSVWSSTGYAFSNQTLVGTYACSGRGIEVLTPTAGSPVQSDYTYVAIAKYDGGGHESGKLTITFNENSSPPTGFSCTYTQTGTYTVNPDGTGSSTVQGTTVSGPCDNTTEVESFVLDDAIGTSATFIPTSDTTTGGVIDSNVALDTCERQ